MQLNTDQIDRILRYSSAWSEAEEALKLTENELGDVVIPSVNELRYAGRKLADCLAHYIAGTNSVTTEVILEDAIVDCLRARHDSTDAAISYIAGRLQLAVEKFGIEAVTKQFPGYRKLLGLIRGMKRVISIARKDSQRRNELYSNLESKDLIEVIQLYDEFVVAETDMKDDRFWSWLRGQSITVGLLITTIVAVVTSFRN